MTQVPLTYSPWTGESLPPVSAHQHRDHFTYGTWRFNPWTGIRRPQSEIQADPQGLKLTPPTPTCAPAQPLLVYNPWSGCRLRLLATSDPNGFRNRHGYRWDFNPWTGSRRPAAEVEADPQGLKLEPPSHDPGTTSPPTPATTEAGTGTQEPGATDREPASTSSPPPTNAFTQAASALQDMWAASAFTQAASAFTQAASALQDLRVENETLTRSAVDLAAKCRTLQAENERLRGFFQRIAVNADQCRFGRAVSRLTEEALNPEPGTGPHMRAAAGEGDDDEVPGSETKPEPVRPESGCSRSNY